MQAIVSSIVYLCIFWKIEIDLRNLFQDLLQPVLKEVPPAFMPPKWLSEVVPRKAPYYPQMGDHVMFFQEGYRLYLEAVRKKQIYKPSTRDSFAKFGLQDPVYAQVGAWSIFLIVCRHLKWSF